MELFRLLLMDMPCKLHVLCAHNKCRQGKAGNFKDSMKFPSSCTIAGVGSGIWSTRAQAARAQGSPDVAALMPSTPCNAAGHASSCGCCCCCWGCCWVAAWMPATTCCAGAGRPCLLLRLCVLLLGLLCHACCGCCCCCWGCCWPIPIIWSARCRR